jgi:hypothetical protein
MTKKIRMKKISNWVEQVEALRRINLKKTFEGELN